MSRLQIPYNRVLFPPRACEEDSLDSLLEELLERSEKKPVILELFNNHVQYFLFFRERQIYWAGRHSHNGFDNNDISEVMAEIRRMEFPHVVAYQSNVVLFHSILVYMQNKPELKVSSTLIDLEELVDRAESERKNALVTAYQNSNILMLRLKDSHPFAFFNEFCNERQKTDRDIREEFLVATYTLSVHAPFEITLHTDLVVEKARDSRPIPEEHLGRLTSFYLSDPPKLVVKLKNRPLKTYKFIGKELTVGRLPGNDIEIDNLSVSRKHASISIKGNHYILKDLNSRNSTYLNGKKINSAELKDNDTISIGKYQIIFKMPKISKAPPSEMDRTVIIPDYHGESGDINIDFEKADDSPARLLERKNQKIHLLESDRITIGRSRNADIRFTGLLAP
ncbi:MAG: FHA domain-containing protein, partial [Candidatus Latescibacteria bacterium]|nr:FHA domain-containing protein [bacterium]MBD3423188.1 FHA domain-containing protein [Candidatus Latescibacterota bacterium]